MRRPRCRSRSLPSSLRSSRRRPAGPRSGRGGPTSTPARCGAGPAGVGEARARAPPTAPASWRPSPPASCGRSSRPAPAPRSRSRSGGSTTSLRMPELAGPLGGDALVAADERHAHDRPPSATCRTSAIASYAVTWPTDTCGSRNVASDAAITMSASATKCRPPPAHDAVDRGDHRLPDLVVPGGEVAARPAWCAATARAARPGRGELGHVEAGLERRPVAGVDDHPHVGVGVELAPGPLELVAASWRPWRCRRSGRSNTSQPTGPSPLDDQRLVAGYVASRRSTAGHLAPGRVAATGRARGAGRAPARRRCSCSPRSCRPRSCWPGCAASPPPRTAATSP